MDGLGWEAMRCDAMRNAIRAVIRNRMGSTAKTSVCHQLRFRTWIHIPPGAGSTSGDSQVDLLKNFVCEARLGPQLSDLAMHPYEDVCRKVCR